jgi:hypothetical protein
LAAFHALFRLAETKTGTLNTLGVAGKLNCSASP